MELAYNILLFALLAGSVYTDLRWRLIKNVVVFPAFLCGLILRYFDTGLPGLSFGLQGALFGFLMVFVTYHFIGGLGEGDVKLMAAVGVLVGPHNILLSAVFASFYGALISIIILARERKLKETLVFTVMQLKYLVFKLARRDLSKTDIKDTGTKIAYAVPIALGVVTAGFYMGW